MRDVDPDVRVIAVGRCVPGGAEDWNRRMLEEAGDAADMVSLHYYFPGYTLGRDLADNEDEFRQLLAGARTFGEGLGWALGELDAAGHPEMPVAIDEWSMWSAWDDLIARNHRLCDSIYFGGCLNRMIERADRVRFAMISHLVNSLAPIQTTEDRMHVTAAYLTLALYRRTVRRHRVELDLEVPLLGVVPLPGRAHNKPLGGTTSDIRGVPAVDAVATADDGAIALHVCTGTLDEPVRATVHGLMPGARGHARWITGPGPFARNRFDAPATLGYAQATYEADARGTCTVELAPATVTALVFEP
jgi:alpha-L-arabinofuranosidase